MKKNPNTKSEQWADQAVAEFGDGRIVAGVDYLKQDFTAIDVPPGMVPCWAPEDEDLTRHRYFKADPQPAGHEMVRRKQVLWLTRRDVYERRREIEREVYEARTAATEAISQVEEDGGEVIRREGPESMARAGDLQ